VRYRVMVFAVTVQRVLLRVVSEVEGHGMG
jgi:hypothetical protein